MNKVNKIKIQNFLKLTKFFLKLNFRKIITRKILTELFNLIIFFISILKLKKIKEFNYFFILLFFFYESIINSFITGLEFPFFFKFPFDYLTEYFIEKKYEYISISLNTNLKRYTYLVKLFSIFILIYLRKLFLIFFIYLISLICNKYLFKFFGFFYFFNEIKLCFFLILNLLLWCFLLNFSLINFYIIYIEIPKIYRFFLKILSFLFSCFIFLSLNKKYFLFLNLIKERLEKGEIETSNIMMKIISFFCKLFSFVGKFDNKIIFSLKNIWFFIIITLSTGIPLTYYLTLKKYREDIIIENK